LPLDYEQKKLNQITDLGVQIVGLENFLGSFVSGCFHQQEGGGLSAALVRKIPIQFVDKEVACKLNSVLSNGSRPRPFFDCTEKQPPLDFSEFKLMTDSSAAKEPRSCVMLKLTVFVLAIALAGINAMGQAPTLRIVQPDGPDLPANLYYGNILVKPLRLRPGTNQPITIDDADFFVSQNYVDFLGRFPDAGGLGYWTDQIASCGNNAQCVYSRRVGVSAAFFIELEFQSSGSFVYRLYKGGLERRPNYGEFGPDRRQVVANPNLEAAKQALALSFVQRPEFTGKYAAYTNATSFVTELIAAIQRTSGANISGQSGALIAKYSSGSNINESRALALRDAIDATAFTTAEYNPSFVVMQYFGYLKRDPEQGGYLFWLDVLNNRVPDNYRGMVCAFITSAEFQLRFGSTATQNDQGCGGI
jgi:Domain of unknown function (DUF4214)